MPQVKSQRLAIIANLWLFCVCGNQISMMTKESETEFTDKTAFSGDVSVNSSDFAKESV